MSAVIVDLGAARDLGYEPSVDLDEGLGAVWREAAANWEQLAG